MDSNQEISKEQYDIEVKDEVIELDPDPNDLPDGIEIG